MIIYKHDGDNRICVDMKSANDAILRENYPLPTFELFMTKLRNEKYFSRLDLVCAYHHLELEEQSRTITTFITYKGLFRYKRLIFGLNSAPEIFQRVLEEIPCNNCLNYLDDLIVFGISADEHHICLKSVLDVLTSRKLKRSKNLGNQIVKKKLEVF